MWFKLKPNLLTTELVFRPLGFTDVLHCADLSPSLYSEISGPQ